MTRFSILVLTLSLCVSITARVHAASDPLDEYSLSNGAQLYELYCSDCHGSDPANGYDQLYEPDETGAVDEYEQLIEMVRQEESAQLIPVPEEEDEWPEWAEMPDPEAEEEPDEKAEVMSAMTALIDEAHGIAPGTHTPDNADEQPQEGPARGFDPVPGATNLADPTAYFYGTSEEEIFDSIANGTGEAMPGWQSELGSDEAIWDVVNYIRSFWGEEWLY